MTEPLDDARGELLALARDCELYAKIIEGIIVVETDWKPGDPERREPRTTLLKAAAALRAAPARCDAESVEAVAKRFIESALQWQPVFEDGRGGNDLPFAETRDLLCKRLAAALVPPPSEAGREMLKLADHDEIGRKLLSLPWAIQKEIVTITSHCIVLQDDYPNLKAADLAACISHCCADLTDAIRALSLDPGTVA